MSSNLLLGLADKMVQFQIITLHWIADWLKSIQTCPGCRKKCKLLYFWYQIFLSHSLQRVFITPFQIIPLNPHPSQYNDICAYVAMYREMGWLWMLFCTFSLITSVWVKLWAWFFQCIANRYQINWWSKFPIWCLHVSVIDPEKCPKSPHILVGVTFLQILWNWFY